MGRHNAPRKSIVGPLARAGTVALAATGPLVLTASPAVAAPATSSILEIIAKCESGNKNVVHNSARSGLKSTASGYLQILDSTWRAFGGAQFASRAIHASREEQFIVGQRVLAGQGINAWSPSKSCWGTKITSSAPAPKTVPKPAPAHKPPTKVLAKKVAKSYVIRRGDTLSQIARTHGTTVQRLASLNKVHNVNRIYAGKTLRLA